MNENDPGLYTPDENFNGTDSFTYRASDGTDWGNTATATVTVTSVEDSPTVNAVNASTDEDTAVDITLDGSDGDGDTLTYSISSDVSNGTTSLSGTTVTYTPDGDWNGTDTFDYIVNDGDEDSSSATVTITVAAVNDLPTTSDIATTIDENRFARMAGITLLGSDADGDNLTYSVVSDASNGTTSISGSTLTYTADQDWNGTETITYKANDGTGDSNTSTITITVTPVNDTPVVSGTDDSYWNFDIDSSFGGDLITLPQTISNIMNNDAYTSSVDFRLNEEITSGQEIFF